MNKFSEQKEIIFAGKKCSVACDGKCSKAWGINLRPRKYFDEDSPDDYVWLSDDELGDAPDNPESYKDGQGKPQCRKDRLNKWCVRECERSQLETVGVEMILPDLTNPSPNIKSRTTEWRNQNS